MPRPLSARIDLGALRHNLAAVRLRAGPARIWAIVKSDAYGHGLLRSAVALQAADGLAVVEMEDAVCLREAGIAKPILLLSGVFRAGEVHTCARYALETVVHCEEQLQMLESAALPAPLKVQIKVNTGMNRLGFDPVRAVRAYQRLAACPAVAGVRWMTHFADADGAGGVAEQLGRFMALARRLPGEKSAANSAALWRFPEARLDWVRPGIALYGCSPFADRTAGDLGLRPAMTLSARIIAVQEVRAGEAVGYGGYFRAPAAMRIGVVACGYADGYPRHAPTGTPVLVAGVCTRTVGRVSMEMMSVDLTGLPEAGQGSEVTLWGDGLPVETVAQSAGTISYELLTALSARVRIEERP